MADTQIYKVQAPDGSVLTVQGPAGASLEQVQSAAMAQYNQMQKPSESGTTTAGGAATGVYPQMSGVRSQQDPERAKNIPMGMLGGVASGMMSPIAALAQFGGYDKPAQAVEKLKQTSADISYPAVASAGSLAGEALNPLPYAAYRYAGKLPQALAKSELLRSGVAGATSGLLTPTAPTQNAGDFAQAKAGQALESGLTGGVLGKLGQMVMNPNVSADIQKLKDMGMKYFTPGQLMGNLGQDIEKKLTSFPFMGSFIQGGMQTTNEDLNRAIGNKVLEPLKEKIPKDVPVGNDMINHIRGRVDDLYNEVLDQANLLNTPQTNKNLFKSIGDATKYLVKDDRKTVEKDLTDNFLGHLEDEHVLDGPQFRNMEKKLSRKANEYYEKGAGEIGDAYNQFLTRFREELRNQNGPISDTLSKAHEVFKNLQPIEKAAAMRGADEGVFSPSQFKSAAHTAAGKTGVATGMGKMVPEANAAVSALGPTLADSGTAGRLAAVELAKKAGAGLLEGGANYLGTGLPILTAAALYNKPAMRLGTILATDRPELMKKAQPYVSGALSSLGGYNSANTEPERKIP